MADSSRVVVIAASVPDGQAWVAAQGPLLQARPVFLTPHSRLAARGVQAVGVFVTPAAQQLPVLPELKAEALVTTLWLGRS